jgi:hypothetical protein
VVSAPVVTHAQLLTEIFLLCREHRQLQAFYWPDSRQAWQKGWPDLTIGGPGYWVFREVKPAFARLSREQRATGYLMLAGGLDWAVWRPADLRSGLIADTVRLVAGLNPGLKTRREFRMATCRRARRKEGNMIMIREIIRIAAVILVALLVIFVLWLLIMNADMLALP